MCGRNIFILGFAIYMGLSIPDYFSTFGPTVTTNANGTPITDAAGNSLSCRNPNLEPINTHNQNFNGVCCWTPVCGPASAHDLACADSAP